MAYECGRSDGMSFNDQIGAGLLNSGQIELRNCTLQSQEGIGPGIYIHNSGATSILHLCNANILGSGTGALDNDNAAQLIFLGIVDIR